MLGHQQLEVLGKYLSWRHGGSLPKRSSHVRDHLPLAKIPHMGFNRIVEPIIDELRRCLKVAGPQKWPDIAAQTGCRESFIRKLAYGDKKNPGLQRVEALRRYFKEAMAEQSA